MKADSRSAREVASGKPTKDVEHALQRQQRALATLRRVKQSSAGEFRATFGRPLNLLFPFALGAVFTKLPRKLIVPSLPAALPWLLTAMSWLHEGNQTTKNAYDTATQAAPDGTTPPAARPENELSSTERRQCAETMSG